MFQLLSAVGEGGREGGREQTVAVNHQSVGI